MDMKRGLKRVGVVFLSIGLLAAALVFLPLKLYYVSAYDSGISLIIVLVALGWGICVVYAWVVEGFKKKPRSGDWPD